MAEARHKPKLQAAINGCKNSTSSHFVTRLSPLTFLWSPSSQECSISVARRGEDTGGAAQVTNVGQRGTRSLIVSDGGCKRSVDMQQRPTAARPHAFHYEQVTGFAGIDGWIWWLFCSRLMLWWLLSGGGCSWSGNSDGVHTVTCVYVLFTQVNTRIIRGFPLPTSQHSLQSGHRAARDNSAAVKQCRGGLRWWGETRSGHQSSLERELGARRLRE